jgi:molybdopterin/thiamine biosynthesis adenylyltransferase
MTIERYARHALIDWFDQECVRNLRVIVVGAGAIGNEVIKNLALLGVGDIHVFDLDVIEASNLTRSVLFREDDIGRQKAECAAARARELDPGLTVVAHHGDFWKALSFSLLRSSAAVFGCVDNFEARIRLSRLCAIADVPMVNTGIDSRYGVVELFPFGTSDTIACYECGLPPSVYASVARRYSCGWLRRVAREERKVPTTILTASGTASLAVSLFLRSVMSPGHAPQSVRLYQDTFTGHSTHVTIARMAGCPGCGDLSNTRIILPANRAAAPVLARPHDPCRDNTILFSDRVLTYLRCRQCEPDGRGEVVFIASDELDETALDCETCRTGKREVGLSDRLEVRELLEDYGGRPWPGKFVIYSEGDLQVVLELSGGSDARSDGDSADCGQNPEGGSDRASPSARR